LVRTAVNSKAKKVCIERHVLLIEVPSTFLERDLATIPVGNCTMLISVSPAAGVKDRGRPDDFGPYITS
jgi:hypothetical protein